MTPFDPASPGHYLRDPAVTRITASEIGTHVLSKQEGIALAPDGVGVVLALLLLAMYFAFRAFIKGQKREASKEFYCTHCEYRGAGGLPRRPRWTWFLLGFFALLFPKKRTCPECNERNTLIPATSARARKAMAANAGK